MSGKRRRLTGSGTGSERGKLIKMGSIFPNSSFAVTFPSQDYTFFSGR